MTEKLFPDVQVGPIKSGMHLDTALNHQRRSISAVIDCFSCSRSFKSTHGWHMQRMNERVWDRLPKNTPQHVRSYVHGYAVALWDALYRYDLEFCYLGTDGVLYSTHKDSVHRKTEEFYARNEGHLLGQLPGNHYWKGTDKLWSTAEVA